MSHVKGVWARLRSAFRARDAEARMDEEFRFHVDMETQRLVAQHRLTVEDARRRAMASFGGLDAQREAMRDGRGTRWLRDTLDDVVYALRLMRRSPSFAIAVAVTIGIGIGVNGQVFGYVDALLFRHLPAADANRLVGMFSEDMKSKATYDFGYADYVDFRDHSDAFDGLAAASGIPLNLGIPGTAGAGDMIWGEMVSENYFGVLRMRPALGRFFDPADAPQGANPFAVISHDAWTHRFQNDSSIIGKVVRLNGTAFTVVGVAPKGFKGLRTFGYWPEVWAPVGMHDVLKPTSAKLFEERGGGSMMVVGRMRQGVDRAQTQDAARRFARRLETSYPATNTDAGVMLVPAAGGFENPRFVKPAIMQLASSLGVFASLLMLTIICANLANLQLARLAARGPEIAIRLSLGCSRRRLMRQMFVESLLLVLPGIAVAAAIMRAGPALERLMVPHLQFNVGIKPTVSGHAMVYASVVAGLAVLLIGLLPALRAGRETSLTQVIGSVRAASAKPRRLRAALVVTQLALSVILLAAASLFVRSLNAARNLDLGFDARERALLSMNIGLQGYDGARGLAFYDDVLRRVRALPEVTAASLAFPVPFDTYGRSASLFVDGASGGPRPGVVSISATFAAEDFINALGLRLERGRDFTVADSSGAPNVMVVSRRLAERLWPGRDPIGQRARRGNANGAEITVVGVVADAKFELTGSAVDARVYLPLRQNYRDGQTLVVHTKGNAALALKPLRATVAAADPQLPLYGAMTLEAGVANGLSTSRTAAYLAGFFGALALVISAVGLYAVVSTGVAERTREIGVRVALGATPREVVRFIMAGGARLGVVGLGLGIVGALLVARLMRSLLFGLSANDPVTFAAVPLILASVIVCATLIPAWRATRVDPIDALRVE